MRALRPAERRRRALAARRRNRWETEECPPADQDIIERADWRMHVMDNMEPIWRALVNYYGFEICDAMRDNNIDPQVARELLRERNEARQLQYAEPMIGPRIRGNES